MNPSSLILFTQVILRQIHLVRQISNDMVNCHQCIISILMMIRFCWKTKPCNHLKVICLIRLFDLEIMPPFKICFFRRSLWYLIIKLHILFLWYNWYRNFIFLRHLFQKYETTLKCWLLSYKNLQLKQRNIIYVTLLKKEILNSNSSTLNSLIHFLNFN